MRLDKPCPVHNREDPVNRGDLAGGRECTLEAHVRQLAETEGAIEHDRVADLEPLPKSIRIVVGHLVDDREGPHLEGEEDGVACLGARSKDGQRSRAGQRGRGGHGRRNSQAAAQDRDRDRSRKGRGGSDANEGAQRRVSRSAPAAQARRV